MDRKLKGIPVYFIALILVSGTVLGAGLWFLTVDVPVSYDEPVEITMYSERRAYSNGDTAGGTNLDFRFRETSTLTQDANLTYETFHQHIEFVNPSGGTEGLEITVELEALDDTGSTTTDLGFVIFPGEVEPRNVTWEYKTPSTEPNHWNATYTETNNEYRVQRGTDSFVTTNLDTTGSTETWTVIYTNKDPGDTSTDEPGSPNYNINGYQIQWDFYESAPQT